jgi:hypothetical protein
VRPYTPGRRQQHYSSHAIIIRLPHVRVCGLPAVRLQQQRQDALACADLLLCMCVINTLATSLNLPWVIPKINPRSSCRAYVSLLTALLC